jgi:glyoxylase-like metal-dependent hydrolase (beta-lactamase superfamily II)
LLTFGAVPIAPGLVGSGRVCFVSLVQTQGIETMPLFICAACGTQYPESAKVPAHCVICEEERQYVPPRGQTWTTLQALRQSYTNTFREYERGIIGVGSTPAFAIGQRALLLRTDNGNILWDCIATLDDATVTMIKGLGGIDAIAISHPHFYTTMVEWAHAFNARIHLHAADKQWIMRNDPVIMLWDGETKTLWDGVTLVRCGGHFEGGTVLHWTGGVEGSGVVCAGDILTVTTDRKWLSFMRSYPNFIPLSARTVQHIAAALKPFAFETIYGHYFDRVIARDAKAVLQASVVRYVAAVEGRRGYV